MGITTSDIELITLAIVTKPEIKSVCELGSQNLYLEHHEKPPFASEYYEKLGLKYVCIDLAGDNNASKIDLSREVTDFRKQFDLVTDFGTSEHVVQSSEIFNVAFHDGHINSIYPAEGGKILIAEGFYNCWKNKHTLLNEGGLMINVNPKTGNWPGHGYTYLTTGFYKALCEKMGYRIILLDENAAMGNTTNGWNIRCVFVKETEQKFLSFEDFSKIETFPS